jgi:hypothetical protein
VVRPPVPGLVESVYAYGHRRHPPMLRRRRAPACEISKRSRAVSGTLSGLSSR